MCTLARGMRGGNDSGIQVPPWIGVWEGEAPRLSVRDIDMEFRGRGDRGSSCTARIETRRRPRGVSADSSAWPPVEVFWLGK